MHQYLTQIIFFTVYLCNTFTAFNLSKQIIYISPNIINLLTKTY